MPDIPEAVLEFLQHILIENRSPAYLQISLDGRLLFAAGELGRYGLSAAENGKPAAHEVPLLEGLLPLQGSEVHLPCVQTPSGRFADILLLGGTQEQWVVFIDSEAQYDRQLLLQQRTNELNLLRQQHEKLLGRLSAAGAGLDLSLLCAKLDTIVLELSADGSVIAPGGVAGWFRQLYAEFKSGQTVAGLGERFPFLDNFMFDAEDFWDSNRDGRLKSGPWTEVDSSGEEIHLEASAICLGGRRLLLIERLGRQYDESRSLLQTVRESRLEEQRRAKEAQKKEILLHCIVHDLAGPLTGIKGCLLLLQSENLSPRGKELLEAGLRQTVRQEKWIRNILEVFAAELASIEAFTRDPAHAPDAAVCSREVVQALLPAAAAEKIILRLSPSVDPGVDWKVAGEKNRLERVLFNLIENALRHTAPGTTVTVNLERGGDLITVMVDDEGPGVPPEAAANMFQKFSQGEGHAGKVGLGLYFCRITVERWGGEIGCYSLPERGARFWFRLPAVVVYSGT